MAFERLEPRRLMASAGDLDVSFGFAGALDLPLTNPLFGVTRVVPLTGGDMLVLGAEIRRLHADGTPDLTFGGGDGVMNLPQPMIDAGNYIENAVILPDGNVFALVRKPGLILPEFTTPTTQDLHLFAPDGTLTATAISNFGAVDQFIVQPDGRVLALGSRQARRLTTDMQVDGTFGNFGGTVPLDGALDIAPDGSIFGVGLRMTEPPQRVIMKFTSEGTVDPSFGVGGEQVAALPADGPVDELEIQADGQLLTIVNGVIYRLRTDGQLDTTFGVGGASNPTFGDMPPLNPQLTALPDGRIMVIKFVGVTRLDASGNIDPNYGRVIANLPGVGVVQSDAAGQVFFTAGGRTQPLALHRLAADGSSATSNIRLENGTVFCIGSESYDDMRAIQQNGDLLIFRRRDDIGRVYNPAEVTLLDFQGLGDNDFITLASAGNIRSTVSGGDGNDKILGGDGGDSLSGNAGRDTIFGGNGADRLNGNGGRDKLIGEGGNDRLYGGSSGDWLIGGGGNDQLFGEGGHDYLQGDSGFDFLHGNAGDDFLNSVDSAWDTEGWIDYLFGDSGKETSLSDPNDILTGIEFPG